MTEVFSFEDCLYFIPDNNLSPVMLDTVCLIFALIHSLRFMVKLQIYTNKPFQQVL